MMIGDVGMFIKLHGVKCELLFGLELGTVLIYLGIFVYMNIKGFGQIDEDVEFILMVLRLTLQFCRLIIAMIRASKVHKQRNENDQTNMNIETASKSTHTDIEVNKRELIVV